jgi:hypothetical protein
MNQNKTKKKKNHNTVPYYDGNTPFFFFSSLSSSIFSSSYLVPGVSLFLKVQSLKFVISIYNVQLEKFRKERFNLICQFH